MKTFLFDLDETLVGGDLISYTSAELLKKGVIDRLYTNKDINYYDLRDLPELLRIRTLERFSDPEYVWYKHPIPGAYFLLKFLESCNHQTGIVTARPEIIRSETHRFIRARFPDIKFDLGINFINTNKDPDGLMGVSKKDYLSRAMPDYYFDDNADHCLAAYELGISTYLISNKHTPWNHKFAEDQISKNHPVKVLRNVAFFPEMRVYGDIES